MGEGGREENTKQKKGRKFGLGGSDVGGGDDETIDVGGRPVMDLETARNTQRQQPTTRQQQQQQQKRKKEKRHSDIQVTHTYTQTKRGKC